MEITFMLFFNNKKQIRTNFDLRNSSDLFRLADSFGNRFSQARRLLGHRGSDSRLRLSFTTALFDSLGQKRKTAVWRFFFFGDPYGNRTHDCAVRGRRLSRLTKGP